MSGVLLSGPIGVGKTHTQQRLVVDHGFWTPTEWTTRPVDVGRDRRRYVPERAFTEAVRGGKFVLPARFAGYWYAWDRVDLERLRTGDGMAALDVRPYTALCLSTLVNDLLAVWLWATPETLRTRRAHRREPRDRDEKLRVEREDRDADDAAYESLFVWRLEAIDTVVDDLLEILHS